MSADTACTLRAPPRFLAPGLEYNGVLQTPPQPRSPLLELGAARQTDWDAAAAGSATARRRSVGCQLASTPLELVVLGSSPTSGCGASDKVWNGTGVGRQRRQSKCTITGSWAETMHTLVSSRVKVASTHVWAKNAVGPLFYSRCLSRRVPPNSTVVIFELTAPNLWGVSSSDLVALVNAVRRQAPALVAFLMWPMQGRVTRELDAVVNAAAMEGQFDVLRALPLIQASGWPISSFYAMSGADTVHPNQLGHAVIASLAARWLLGCACSSSTITTTPPKSTRLGRRSSKAPSKADLKAPSKARPVWEQCYESARELPILGPLSPSSSAAPSTFSASSTASSSSAVSTGWALQNHGSAAKGIDKWGIGSATVGSTLRLGPLPGPSRLSSACSRLSVCLGYSLSAYASPPNGRFRIECSGCDCAPKVDKYRTRLNPFPLVDTAAARSCNRHWHTANVSVTDDTCFQMIWHAHQPCYIDVVNLGAPQKKAKSADGRSQVRVDALSFEKEPTEIGVLSHMYKRPADYQVNEQIRPCRSLPTSSEEMRPVRAFPALALTCMTPSTIRHQCLHANKSFRGYARSHVNSFCAQCVFGTKAEREACRLGIAEAAHHSQRVTLAIDAQGSSPGLLLRRRKAAIGTPAAPAPIETAEQKAARVAEAKRVTEAAKVERQQLATEIKEAREKEKNARPTIVSSVLTTLSRMIAKGMRFLYETFFVG